MTDTRGPDPLAVARQLPRGSGIVFRHYNLPASKRRSLFGQLRSIVRAHGLILMLAGEPALARVWGADGSHGFARGKATSSGLLRSVGVHNPRELVSARRCNADLVFISPVFPTRSHLNAAALGPVRFGLIARKATQPVIALGGMDARKLRRVAASGAYGWAGIDAFA